MERYDGLCKTIPVQVAPLSQSHRLQHVGGESGIPICSTLLVGWTARLEVNRADAATISAHRKTFVRTLHSESYWSTWKRLTGRQIKKPPVPITDLDEHVPRIVGCRPVFGPGIIRRWVTFTDTAHGVVRFSARRPYPTYAVTHPDSEHDFDSLSVETLTTKCLSTGLRRLDTTRWKMLVAKLEAHRPRKLQELQRTLDSVHFDFFVTLFAVLVAFLTVFLPPLDRK